MLFSILNHLYCIYICQIEKKHKMYDKKHTSLETGKCRNIIVIIGVIDKNASLEKQFLQN